MYVAYQPTIIQSSAYRIYGTFLNPTIECRQRSLVPCGAHAVYRQPLHLSYRDVGVESNSILNLVLVASSSRENVNHVAQYKGPPQGPATRAHDKGPRQGPVTRARDKGHDKGPRQTPRPCVHPSASAVVMDTSWMSKDYHGHVADAQKLFVCVLHDLALFF